MKPKICCLLVAFSFCLLNLFSQSQTSPDWSLFPHIKIPQQEKLYLHFDKPSYVAGERMWFRAYLANADTHKPDTSSCAVYVELINNADSLIQRIKVPHKHGVFAGSLLLSDVLPEGTYTVRAYTNWMRNVGADFFYNQQFFVGNSLTSQVSSTVNYRFVDKKTAFAEIEFKQGDKALANKKISYYLNLSGNSKSPKTITTSGGGKISVEYNPSQIDIKKPLIHVAYIENTSQYERNIILPEKDDFDCQFFPEGGELIPFQSNCIAFKAVKLNGYSANVSGAVYDKNNNKLTDINPTHLGMGRFYIYPDSGMQYYALVKNADGLEKRFELPKVNPKAVALQITQLNGKIEVGVKANVKPDSLFLLVHSRTAMICNRLIKDISHPLVFNKNELRAGIVSFYLADKRGRILSERVLFIRPNTLPKVDVQFDKQEYAKRELVNCKIKVVDEKGQAVAGSFSLAATDASDVELNPTATNLVNYLLLSSDLKGHIEEPNSYFDLANKHAEEQLDVLMLTQGWKRFNVQKILEGKELTPVHFLEKGQAVSGLVKAGLLNKPKKGTLVHMLGPNINYFSSTETDSLGRFEFSGLQFPDSTIFTINAKQRRGIKDAVEVYADKDTFPELGQELLRPEKIKDISESQLEASKQKFFLENGYLTTQLKDFEVVASAYDAETVTETDYLSSTLDYEVGPDQINSYADKPLSVLLHSLPGMGTWTEYPPVDDSKFMDDDAADQASGPFFAWDGNVYSYDEVKHIYVGDLASIKVMKKMFGKSKNKYDDKLFVLIFKKDKSLINSQYVEPNFARIMPLGYARNIEFYQPKYEVESVRNNSTPDWRSTLLWQPNVETDAQGEAVCKFYTADRPSKYNIVLEGITPAGEPCHFDAQYQLIKK